MDKEYELKMKELTKLENEIEDLKDKLIFKSTGLRPGEYTEDEFWDCEKSPIGHCVYSWCDSAQDDCLFCHQPSERK